MIALDIRPSFDAGHLFIWSLDPSTPITAAPVSVIEQAPGIDGPWTAISPELTGIYSWRADRDVAPKDPVLFFRARIRVGSDTAVSGIVRPYGVLGRREFLIAAEIMRKEMLRMQAMAGVDVDVFIKAVFGARCDACTDFVTGDSLQQSCSLCFGTGRVPPYYGPQHTFATFSPSSRKKGMQADNTTTTEPYSYVARVLGSVVIKKDDIVIDTASDKRYYVDEVASVLELRRIPVVQEAVLHEIQSSSPLYGVGK